LAKLAAPVTPVCDARRVRVRGPEDPVVLTDVETVPKSGYGIMGNPVDVTTMLEKYESGLGAIKLAVPVPASLAVATNPPPSEACRNTVEKLGVAHAAVNAEMPAATTRFLTLFFERIGCSIPENYRYDVKGIVNLTDQILPVKSISFKYTQKNFSVKSRDSNAKRSLQTGKTRWLVFTRKKLNK
jgi:hypothetical protein